MLLILLGSVVSALQTRGGFTSVFPPPAGSITYAVGLDLPHGCALMNILL